MPGLEMKAGWIQILPQRTDSTNLYMLYILKTARETHIIFTEEKWYLKSLTCIKLLQYSRRWTCTLQVPGQCFLYILHWFYFLFLKASFAIKNLQWVKSSVLYKGHSAPLVFTKRKGTCRNVCKYWILIYLYLIKVLSTTSDTYYKSGAWNIIP